MKAATELKITKPVLTRQRQCSMIYFLGEAPFKFHDNVKYYYRQIYFESINIAVNWIKSRFEQKDYVSCYAKVESILLLAAKGEPFDEHILVICPFFANELDQHNLHLQLTLLGTLFDGINPFHPTNLFWYPLRTSENQRFFLMFLECIKRDQWHEILLIGIVLTCHLSLIKC